MPLTLNRTFSSGAAAFNNSQAPRGLLGEKWRTSFDYAIESTYWYLVYLWRPDGQRIAFRYSSGGRYLQITKSGDNPKSYIEVVSRGPGGFPELLEFRAENGEVEIYRTSQIDRYYAAGKIVERRNAQGIAWKFEYTAALPWGALSKVRHSSGRSVQFNPGAIIDQAGNTYQHGFVNGNLVSVTKPGTPNTVITYHYENNQYPRVLTGKSFNGVRYSTFKYDADGRAVSSEHAGGVERYTFSYSGASDGAFQAAEINPLGHRSVHSYDAGKKISVTGDASARCAYRYRSFTYDANGNEDVATDYVGSKTDSDYDEHNHLVRQVEAVGDADQRTTTYTWDESRNLLSSVTLQGVRSTSYSYDSLNRMVAKIVTDISSGQTRTTTYAYTNHPNKLIASYTVDGPLSGSSDAVTHYYSATGELLRSENGLSHVVSYSNHTGLGMPGRIVKASGALSEYEYDAGGRLIVEREFPNGSAVETRYTYGASGLLEAISSTDGNMSIYHYDAARRLVQQELSDVAGGYAVKRLTYDAMSNPLKIEIGRDN